MNAKILRIDLIFIAKLKQLLSYKYKILFIFIIYLIALSALILANFNYIDDRNRILYGSFEFFWWNRHSSTFAASLLSLNSDYFVVTFPYSLFISIFLLSLSSIIFLKTINNKLIHSKIALLASVSIGLSPYYLENLSYKFDAPLMALSVFASIFPFLFVRYSKIFIITSIIMLLIMLTSYQASSGIYMMICIFLAFIKILQNDTKGAFRIFICFAISYLIVGILYLMIYRPEATYANTHILPFKYFFIGVSRHIIEYTQTIYSDFGGANRVYLFLIFGFVLIFIAKSIIDSKINKILAFLLSVFCVVILFILSFGLYLIIVTPTLYPRSFIGFGVFIGILSIYSIHKNKILSSVLIIIFVHYLIMFANFYGQALKAQSDYENFRWTLMLNDLGKFLNTSHMDIESKFNIKTKGKAGVNPVIIKSKKQYPIIDRLVPILQNDWFWNLVALDNFGITGSEANRDCEKYSSTQILIDTYFHKIESFKPNNDTTCFIITYKNITDHKSNF